MVSKGVEYWNGREECGGEQRAVIGPVVAFGRERERRRRETEGDAGSSLTATD